MNEVAINGQVPSWADVSVTLLTREVEGITAVDYEDGVTVKPVRGRGIKRVGRVKGMYEATASLTLLMTEVEAINQSLPAGSSIYDIKPFDVTVCYINEDYLLITHVLKDCTFTKQGRSSKTGDVSAIEVKLPLDVSEINWTA
jgi:hypothetical protein